MADEEYSPQAWGPPAWLRGWTPHNPFSPETQAWWAGQQPAAPQPAPYDPFGGAAPSPGMATGWGNQGGGLAMPLQNPYEGAYAKAGGDFGLPQGMPASAPSLAQWGVSDAATGSPAMGMPPPSGAPAPMTPEMAAQISPQFGVVGGQGMPASGGAIAGYQGPKLDTGRLPQSPMGPRVAPPQATPEVSGPTASLKGPMAEPGWEQIAPGSPGSPLLGPGRGNTGQMPNMDNILAGPQAFRGQLPQGQQPPQAAEHRGPMDWRELAAGIKAANPDIPPAALASAVMSFMPLMHQQSKLEFAALLQEKKLAVAEYGLAGKELDLAKKELEYDRKLGGIDTKGLTNEYHQAIQERQHAVNTVAQNPNSKEAKNALKDADARWQAVQSRYNAVFAPQQGQQNNAPYTGYLTKLRQDEAAGKHTVEEGLKAIEAALPKTFASWDDSEKRKVAMYLHANPDKADAYLAALAKAAARDPRTTEVEKTR